MHRSSHLLVEAREAYVRSCFSSRWCQREALCSSPSSAMFWAWRGAGFREKVTPFALFSSRLICSSFPAVKTSRPVSRDSKVWRQHRWGTGGGPATHIWWEKKTNHPSWRGCKHGALTVCLSLSCNRKEALYVGLFCSTLKSYCNSGCVEKEQFRDRFFFFFYCIFPEDDFHIGPFWLTRGEIIWKEINLCWWLLRKAANEYGLPNVNKCHGWCTE